MASDTATSSAGAEGTAITQQRTDVAPAISVTLDIADVVSAVFWPLLILIIILATRKHLPAFFGSLPKVFDRVQKISIGNFSLELAKVAAIAPQWTPTDSAMDIRKSMSSAEVSDSTAGHFTEQLADTTPADFALVDLGEGREWLSSRLFIISVLLERAKDVRAFVFVRTAGRRTRKLIGWAEPAAIRWSLARQYPWLEGAYARSYALILPAPPPGGPGAPAPAGVQIVSRTGMLGRAQEGASPHLLIQLMQTFLAEIQSPAAPIPEEVAQWVELQATVPTWEQACWLTADDIDEILGDDLKTEYVHSAELDGMDSATQAKRLIAVKQPYVPIVDDSERFRDLIDRQVVLERVAAEVGKA